ncbi:hypothetical protein T11_684 [Trichinella zimbabwensis]|uniref:Uncharacterized protein n=1 Tax=Trichinella zimbabwensis TaxID=268475 RepID=A0A0V1HPI9_9BILA|nr:hypothetical protein T11_684 [Trichinella zimbabwensis]
MSEENVTLQIFVFTNCFITKEPCLLHGDPLAVKRECFEYLLGAEAETVMFLVEKKHVLIADAAKYEAIKKCQFPDNVKELRNFLGLALFYGRFLWSFIARALLLITVLRKQAN